MSSQEVRLDRFTRCLLTVIAVLLTVIAVELWQARPSMLPSAMAQIPDAGAQRYSVIAEAQKTNELLASILDHLRNKPIKVQTQAETTDKSSAGRSRPK
ncbi:MAG TPA: hypothetical protein VMV94_10835 [Phycisphaerae bacterium]|nr:hypothetical protein [Phycisphaerae bacterium]